MNCEVCNKNKPFSSYSKTQLRKKYPKRPTCTQCIGLKTDMTRLYPSVVTPLPLTPDSLNVEEDQIIYGDTDSVFVPIGKGKSSIGTVPCSYCGVSKQLRYINEYPPNKVCHYCEDICRKHGVPLTMSKDEIIEFNANIMDRYVNKSFEGVDTVSGMVFAHLMSRLAVKSMPQFTDSAMEQHRQASLKAYHNALPLASNDPKTGGLSREEFRRFISKT